MNIREMLDRRANLVSQAREILDTAEAENRSMSAEENERWERLHDEAADLTEQIQRHERQAAAEQPLAGMQTALRPEPGDGNRQMPRFVSRGMREITDYDPDLWEQPLWQRLFPYATDEYRSTFVRTLRRAGRQTDLQIGPEMQRALQSATDIYGGYLVTPVQFVDRLIQAVDNLTWIRQWASVFPVPNAESLGAVSLDNDPADPTWTSELAIGSEDSTMSFGKRELNPYLSTITCMSLAQGNLS